MTDLYIYYRVPDAHAARLAPRVLAMQAALSAAHQVAAQVRRRPGSADGLQTWMEIYPSTPAGFADALALAVSAAALGELIAGPRHTELFTDLQTCA